MSVLRFNAFVVNLFQLNYKTYIQEPTKLFFFIRYQFYKDDYKQNFYAFQNWVYLNGLYYVLYLGEYHIKIAIQILLVFEQYKVKH